MVESDICTTASADNQIAQVPFGNEISNKVLNYHRHRPSIATSGKLAPGALAELKEQGFKSILDLRTTAEGVAEERDNTIAAGLAYQNLPVGKEWPNESLLADFVCWCSVH